MLIKRKWRNLQVSIKAIVETWRAEPSFRMQLITGAAIFIAAGLMRVSMMEWALLVLAFSAVISVELINTAIERVADAFGRHDPQIGLIKDLGSAAAGSIGLGAIAICLLVFGAHLR